MRRFLAICLFATAAAATTAAGSGVVIAPHIDPPGTPLFHTHDLATYRMPLFFNVPQLPLAVRGASIEEESLFDASVVIVLALLALAIPRLPRPTLRAIAEVATGRATRAPAHAANEHGPPRAALQRRSK